MNDQLERLIAEREPEFARLRRERDPEIEPRISDADFYGALGLMLEYGVRIALVSFGYRERES